MGLSLVQLNLLRQNAACTDCQAPFTNQNPAIAHDECKPIHLRCLEKQILDQSSSSGKTQDSILKCGVCFKEISQILGIPVKRPMPDRQYALQLADQIVEKGIPKKGTEPTAKGGSTSKIWRAVKFILGGVALVLAAAAIRQGLGQSFVQCFGPGKPFVPILSSAEAASLVRERFSHFKEGTQTMGSVCNAPKWMFSPPEQCFPLQVLEQDIQQAFHENPHLLSLDETALAPFGNKHLNLVKMNHLVEALDLDEVVVPAPIGIDSGRITAFLKRSAPEVFEQWKALAKLGVRSLQSPEAAALLQTIREAVIHAFSKGTFEELGITKEEQSSLQKNEFLMVRSTGAEDGKKSPNAGGNTSKAYVRPDQESLFNAVGEVVASYFGEASLQNRINAGDNPFREELLLAVTTQPLIGEPAGGAEHPSQIPSSFVLFTNEPLYIGGEKFRAMRLSSTFGHGEAVVNNLGIGTDTALILHSESRPDQLYLIYDNQNKPFRLAPWETAELKKFPNPVELTQRHALTQDEILRIYRSGVLMESFFEEPTDIEGVVLEGQVHFVQARPLNRKPLLPTYLDAPPSASKLQAETITPGTGSVVSIYKTEEILFAQTLKEAERVYNKDLHKAIVVAESEPDNSHPANNFSTLGVPSLYAPDYKAVIERAAKIDADHPLALCMQTATLHFWNNAVSKLEDAIRPGFAVHPAKIAISLSDTTVSENVKQIPQELKGLILQLRQGNLNALEGNPWIRSIQEKMESAKQKLSAMEHPPKEALDRIAAFELLQEKIASSTEELRVILRRPGLRLQPLLQIKILETLLAGSPRKNQIGHFSLLEAESSLRSIDTLIEYQKKLPYPAKFTRFVLAKAPSLEALHKWEDFLIDAEAHVHQGKATLAQVQLFENFVSLLQKTEALPTWLTFFQNQFSAAPSRFEQFLQTASSDRVLLEDVSLKHEFFIQTARQADRFADPKNILQAAEELKSVTDDLFSPEKLHNIRSASPLSRLIAHKTLRSAIETYDAAVKAMKASPSFTNAEKVHWFKQMLGPMHSSMRSLAQELAPQDKIRFNKGAVPSMPVFNWNLKRYLDVIESNLSKLGDASELLMPTSDFSVSAAMISSGASFAGKLPKTLEDFFTLFHQNSLALLSYCDKELLTPQLLTDSFLPKTFKQALSIIDNTEWDYEKEGIGKMLQTGIEINENEILWHYNVPLREHSGHPILQYSIASGKMNLKCQILGLNELWRWDIAAAWLGCLDQANVLKLQQSVFAGRYELTFNWDVSSENLDTAVREYLSIASYSMKSWNFKGLWSPWQTRPEFPELISAAAQVDFSHIQKQALEILPSLANQGKIPLSTLIEAAKLGFLSKDYRVRRDSFKLFNSFFEKNQGFEAAAKAAQIEFERPAYHNDDAYPTWLNLFESLFKHGKGFETAAEAVRFGSRSSDPVIRAKAEKLSEALKMAQNSNKNSNKNSNQNSNQNSNKSSK